MTESNVQAKGKSTFHKISKSRFGRRWNSYVTRPVISRLMRVAVLKHTGRLSGRVYTTPVSARPTVTGFVVPLSFGEKADWYRNILAANGCVIQWKGVEYRLIDPQMISLVEARSAFNFVERWLLPVTGIKQFIQFRHAPARGEDSALEIASPENALSQ
jgi:deazaflavin-dependent oxidoreductase (nitroreductase family)